MFSDLPMLVEAFGIDTLPGAKEALAFVLGTIDGTKAVQDIVAVMRAFFSFVFSGGKGDVGGVADVARELGDVIVVNGTNV